MRILPKSFWLMVLAGFVLATPGFAADDTSGQGSQVERPLVQPSGFPPPPPPPSEPQGKDVPKSKVVPGSGLFRKDVNSRIFMLMKNWKCENGDGAMFLKDAIQAYGKEAEDSFNVTGLLSLPKFSVSVDERDITLDELLDILSKKYGFFWGVSLPEKTIYFSQGDS